MATLETSDPWVVIERGIEINTYSSIGNMIEALIYKTIARSGDPKTTMWLLQESVQEAYKDFIGDDDEEATNNERSRVLGGVVDLDQDDDWPCG